MRVPLQIHDRSMRGLFAGSVRRSTSKSGSEKMVEVLAVKFHDLVLILELTGVSGASL